MSHKSKTKTFLNSVSLKNLSVKSIEANDLLVKSIETDDLLVKSIETDDLLVDGADVEVISGATDFLNGSSSSSKIILPRIEEVTLENFDVSLTDLDLNGAFSTNVLFTLPDSHLVILGCFVSLAISAGSNIEADASVVIGIGTGVPINGEIKGTSSDIVSATSIQLASSEGDTLVSSITRVSCGKSQDVNLNFGITGASISDDETITTSGTVRLVYLDLGGEA